MVSKVAIIGTGPAGYSAGLYSARAILEPIVFGGPAPGGQLMNTLEVENYPGFPKGIIGSQLMDEMRKQAVKFGAQVKFEIVTKIDTSKRPFEITTDQGKYRVGVVILAMGAKSKMLNMGEEKLLGKGVSTCAVCDGAFFKDKVTYVVGGGDAAIEEAWALSKHAKSVTILVRRGELRASKIMQKRVRDNPEKIKVMWNVEVKEVVGGEKLEEIVVESKVVPVRSPRGRDFVLGENMGRTQLAEEPHSPESTNDDLAGLKSVPAESKIEQKVLKADGLFLAIGHIPATEFLKNTDITLDAKGYIVTGQGLSDRGVEMANSRMKDGLVQFPTMTSVEGIFAAGDVVDFRYQQAITAAGMGVAASLDAERWLNEQNSV